MYNKDKLLKLPYFLKKIFHYQYNRNKTFAKYGNFGNST